MAVEIHGSQCSLLAAWLETRRRVDRRSLWRRGLRVHLSAAGEGWRLRRCYLDAFKAARERIWLAHGYFLPDAGVVRALVRARRRGVEVRLLLAGVSDVPLARAATRSVHRRLLAAGVQIYEWSDSVLHAKLATVDGQRLLVGSFNLDPLSLANLETLVEVREIEVVAQADRWIERHVRGASRLPDASTSSAWQRWLVEPLGRLVLRVVELTSRLLAGRRSRRPVLARPG